MSDMNTGLQAVSLPHSTDDFVYVEKGLAMTDSRKISQKFGKRHADVLRSIKNLECSPEFTERNFAPSEYVDGTGRTLPTFKVTRDGFTFLITGFTGKEAAKFKEEYIAAFNWMEQRLMQVGYKEQEQPVLLAATVKQLESKIQEVTQQLEQAVTLKMNEQKIVQQAIGRRVVVLAKDKKARPVLYRLLYHAIYAKFEVQSYRDLLKRDFEEALKFIALWYPQVEVST